ncbi:PhnE/PtxC family ABC transporter permease [Halobacterium wangiae]|uniref:PhnE/PtxC family ABC transporter permease n=1 Tax=Halobacterium wangiae TaxID=2902623 RepID=UPI001E47B828|nr:ABC transporter permease subunit [Halobacterium wangiae]
MASSDIKRVKDRIERKQRRRRILGALGIFFVAGATALGMRYVGFTVAELIRQFPIWLSFVAEFLNPDFVDFTLASKSQGVSGLDGLWYSLTHPSTIVESAGATQSSGSVLVAAAVMTIIVGFTGTVLGFPLALLLGVLGSERVTPFPFNFIFRGTMSTIRAVPSLVWILIYIPLFGISPKSAIFAIATDTIGNLGRLFTDELEEINDGPIEAISSTGANRPQTVIFGMLSQVSSSFIAWTMYVLEINTRIAISLGVVGAGGLGQYISLKIQFGTPDAYAQAAAGLLMVVLIVISVELLSSRIRARLRPGETQETSFFDAVKGLFDADKWTGRSSD